MMGSSSIYKYRQTISKTQAWLTTNRYIIIFRAFRVFREQKLLCRIQVSLGLYDGQ